MNQQTAVRMCPECMTTDSHFPNIQGCATCASMISHDEALFWNTPVFMEPQYNDKGESVGYLPVFPEDVMQQMRIPWYINLIRMFMLE
jgi:hypothetical protein